MEMPRRGLVVSIEKVRTSGAASSAQDAVLRYLDHLYRFALRLTGESSRAEDLTQETTVRALERQNAILLSPRAWLFRILYHTFVDQYRRDQQRGMPDEDTYGEAEVEGLVDTIPALVAIEDVRNAIGDLPEEFRAVVWLSDAEGFRLQEIAEILRCPLGTVASRLARARRQLRRLLAAYGPPEEK